MTPGYFQLGSGGGVIPHLGSGGVECDVTQVLSTPPGCECPDGYQMAYDASGPKYWCQKIKATDSGWKFDWSTVPSAIAIACQLFGKSCPVPYTGTGALPPGYYEPPWYTTTGGILGIIGGLALVGGLGYYALKK